MDTRTQEFLEYVQSGGQVETGDWLPDEYRSRLIKFIEMHGNSELMGVLPERDWILRAPTLQRKLALTAKIQDEVGHAQLIYRVVEDLGKPRSACLDDLVSGKAKFHNVFHYPTKTWGDVGVIAWLVDAAAIVSQKALLKCSYAPYARIMKKICWEESFHILHGRDVILAWSRHARAVRARPGGARPLVGAADALPRQPDPGRRGPDVRLADQEPGERGGAPAVPRRLRAADPGARPDDPRPGAAQGRGDGVWDYTEPDWDELRAVVTGHGPASEERLDFRRRAREHVVVGRSVVLAEAAPPRVIYEVFFARSGRASRSRTRARSRRRPGVRRDLRARAVRPRQESSALWLVPRDATPRGRRVPRRVRPQVPPRRRLLDQGEAEGGT